MNIIDRFDEWIMLGERRERRSHYPSDVNSCLRQLYYKWNGVEQSDPPSPGNMLKMKSGLWVEELFEQYLDWEKEQGTLRAYDTQVEVNGREDDLEYPIHGYMDVVMTTKNEQIGVELKSSFGRGIKEIQQNGPKEEHLLQVFQYLRYSGVDRFLLPYFARDNGYRTVFDVQRRGKYGLLVNGEFYGIDWPHYIRRLVAAENTIGEEVPPYQEFKVAIVGGEIKEKIQREGIQYKSDYQCRYCNWKSLCHGEEIERSKEHGEALYGGEKI